MKSDINGVSTTQAGQEQWEEFWSHMTHGWLIQYDYRTPEGKLFSTIFPTLERARARRDAWLEEQS